MDAAVQAAVLKAGPSNRGVESGSMDACRGSKQDVASGAGQIASMRSICAPRRRTC